MSQFHLYNQTTSRWIVRYLGCQFGWHGNIMAPDRIPSTTPGAEPHVDARDAGSARSHSTHLETSSSDRP